MNNTWILDGVAYGILPNGDIKWRIGTTNPLWKEKIAILPSNPDEEDLKKCASDHIWLSKENEVKPLAVICCGLGSAYTGMGRQLYDNFPEARNAMDDVAKIADWDVLSIMDETDLEKVNNIRWQIPYLFLIEYAQYRQFLSLGLKPALYCGHSIGEIIALCFAGIYDLDVAWYMMEMRARKMEEHMERSNHVTGMMAVHANIEIVNKVLLEWPELSVSNYNTPCQVIMSGPKDILREARNSLRKQKIPAMLLSMNSAFHHKSMRLLRYPAFFSLNALKMQAPSTPVLSNVTTEVYPSDQVSICEHIVDLDENPVRFVECVNKMWDEWKIRSFLEFGPQDTVSGLIKDCVSDAICFSSSRKGKESEVMRDTCAKLFAYGYLSKDCIYSSFCKRGEQKLEENKSTKSQVVWDENSKIISTVLKVLSKYSSININSLRPEMDLRYDLGLRSSKFPFILQEIEELLSIKIDFEKLLSVITIADFVRILDGDKSLPEKGRINKVSKNRQINKIDFYHRLDINANVIPIDPLGNGVYNKGDTICILLNDEKLFPKFLESLASIGANFVVQDKYVLSCKSLEKFGIQVISDQNCSYDAIITDDIDKIAKDIPESIKYIYILTNIKDGEEIKFVSNGLKNKYANKTIREIVLLNGVYEFLLDSLSDMLAYELVHSEEDKVIWSCEVKNKCKKIKENLNFASRIFCDESSKNFNCQISLFAEKELEQYRLEVLNTENAASVPVSIILQSLIEASHAQFSWLRPIALTDIHLKKTLFINKGITRQAQIVISQPAWFSYGKNIQKLCRTKFLAHDLVENGRKIDQMSMIAEMIIHMASSNKCEHNYDIQDEISNSGKIIDQSILDEFYSCLNIGQYWQLIKGARKNSDTCFESILSLSHSCIDFANNMGYINSLRLIDGAIHTGILAILIDIPKETWNNNLPRCTSISHVHLGLIDNIDPLELCLVKTWEDERFIRFNCEISDGKQNVVQIYHMEFDCHSLGNINDKFK